MGKRKVSILESAASSIAEIAFFIESKGLPDTAKIFVSEAFDFFERLSDDRVVHKLCRYHAWEKLNFRCVPYKKKYTVAYMSNKKEIVICEFVPSKLIH